MTTSKGEVYVQNYLCNCNILIIIHINQFWEASRRHQTVLTVIIISLQGSNIMMRMLIMDARVTQREEGVVSAASDLLCSSFNFFPFNLDHHHHHHHVIYNAGVSVCVSARVS